MNNQEPFKINREEAFELIKNYLPFINYFNDRQEEYCCCGGTAVMLHAINKTDMPEVRGTEDLDIFIPNNYHDVEIAEIYIKLYCKEFKDDIDSGFNNVFGEGSRESFLNDYVGVVNSKIEDMRFNDNPSFDTLRLLNGFTVDTIPKEDIYIFDNKITIATKEALLKMKTDTIKLIESMSGVGSGRPRDYIDANLLRKMIENASV